MGVSNPRNARSARLPAAAVRTSHGLPRSSRLQPLSHPPQTLGGALKLFGQSPQSIGAIERKAANGPAPLDAVSRTPVRPFLVSGNPSDVGIWASGGKDSDPDAPNVSPTATPAAPDSAPLIVSGEVTAQSDSARSAAAEENPAPMDPKQHFIERLVRLAEWSSDSARGFVDAIGSLFIESAAGMSDFAFLERVLNARILQESFRSYWQVEISEAAAFRLVLQAYANRIPDSEFLTNTRMRVMVLAEQLNNVGGLLHSYISIAEGRYQLLKLIPEFEADGLPVSNVIQRFIPLITFFDQAIGRGRTDVVQAWTGGATGTALTPGRAKALESVVKFIRLYNLAGHQYPHVRIFFQDYRAGAELAVEWLQLFESRSRFDFKENYSTFRKMRKIQTLISGEKPVTRIGFENHILDNVMDMAKKLALDPESLLAAFRHLLGMRT